MEEHEEFHLLIIYHTNCARVQTFSSHCRASTWVRNRSSIADCWNGTDIRIAPRFSAKIRINIKAHGKQMQGSNKNIKGNRIEKYIKLIKISEYM